MSENELNIFVSIAPSHIKNFEDIIKMGSSVGQNVLVNAGNYPYSSEMWGTVINCHTKMGNPTGSNIKNIRFQLNKISSYSRIIKRSKKSIPKKKFNLYYCNLEDVLNNYFFFNFRNQLLKEPILVEDGILNYYSYILDDDRKKIFKVKQLLSSLFGIPYRWIGGQLSGIDMNLVKKQFVKYPTQAIFPEKAIALPIKCINYIPNEDKILFIGQDILENIIGAEKYILSIREIIKSIRQVMTEESRLLYKPHRNGSYSTTSNILKETFNDRYELVLDNTPVEDLIGTIKPYHIFSFYSTALINIKMSLPEDSPIKIYSKPLATTDTKILNLFRESGINIIE